MLSSKVKRFPKRVLSTLARRSADRQWFAYAIFCWQMSSFFGNKKPVKRYSQKLLEDNEIEQYARLLLSVSASRLSEVDYAKKRIYMLALWYGRSGHLEKGESVLEGLGDASLKREYLIRFWAKFACFDGRRIKRVYQFLDEGLDVYVARAALKILWLVENDEKSVAGFYIQYLHKADPVKDRVFIQEALSVLHVSRQFDQVKEVLSDIQGAERFSGTLALQDGSLNSVLPACPALHELNMMAEVGRQNVHEKLRNKQLRVAVVGNSPREVGSGKGSEIDAHDIVIRFNKFSLAPEFHADYGSRVTMVVVTKSITHRPLSQHPKGIDLLVTGEDPLVFPPPKGYPLDFFKDFGNVLFSSKAIYSGLVERLGAAPSSGLQVLELINDLRDGLDGVSLYGFGFVDQIGDKAGTAGYGRKSKPSFRHNWRGEAEYFNWLAGLSQRLPNDLKAFRYDNALGDLKSFRPTRIKLLGDHSRYHCGSKAVMNYLKEYVSYHGVLVQDESFDLLVVNGEGSMHHDSNHHIQKMEAIKAAQEKGKRVALVNTVWQENSHKYDDVLKELDLISAREELSRRELEKHGVNAQTSLDFSYWAPLRGGKIKDFRNKPVVTDFYSHEFGTFVVLNGGREAKLPYLDMKTMNWPTVVKSLRTASVLITGRHHAVYAACKAEIPFIAFRGNTHKIEGLIESSGIPIPMCSSREELPELLRWVEENRHMYEELYRWMRSQPKFTIPFELL